MFNLRNKLQQKQKGNLVQFDPNNNLILVSTSPFKAITIDQLNSIVKYYNINTAQETLDLIKEDLKLNITLKELKELLKELCITKSTKPVFTSTDFIPEQKPDEIITSLKKELFQMKKEVDLLKQAKSTNEVVRESIQSHLKGYSSHLKNINDHRARVLISSGLKRNTGHTTICLSDWHGGALYDGERLVKGSGYSLDILKSRVDNLISKIHFNTYMFKGSRSIEISILGDLFESILGNMRVSQGLTMDLGGMELIKLMVSHVSSVINATVERYSDRSFTLSYVGGNHDRLTKDKQIDSDRILLPIFVELLKNSIDSNVQIQNKKNKKWHSSYATPSIRQIINHGDNRIDPKNVFMLDSINPAQYRVLIEAHLHHKYIKEYNNLLHVVAPSMVGSTYFSEMDMGISSLPCQLVLKYEDDPTLVSPFYLDL